MLHSPQIFLGSRQATAAAPPAAPTWTATDNPVAQDTSTTSVTFSGANIGSPAASDVIVVVYSSETTVASSVTCNSVAMTKQAQESTTLSGLQIWSITATAAGVTGLATTTFIATASGNMNQEVIQVGKLTGVNSAPPNTGAVAVSSIGVTVPSTGYAIVGAYGTKATVSWSGGTQDFVTTTLNNASDLWMVRATATGTVSETGGVAIHMVYAAWGP